MVAEANDVVLPKLSTTLLPATAAITGNGVIISTTDAIQSFLIAASSNSHLSKDLRDLSSSLIMQSELPYKALKTVWSGLKHETQPDLCSLLSGSRLIFTRPKPREKSEQLKARLKKLQEAAERKAYQALVKDISPRKGVEEPFSSYKDQFGFGLHVVLIMLTGCLLGYLAFTALFHHSPVMSASGSILGLVLAMLFETLMFIVRLSEQQYGSPYSDLKIKKE